MTEAAEPQKSRSKKPWVVGLIVGVVLTIVMVLASGFMIDTTNKDVFCVSCHVMKPFRMSWQEAATNCGPFQIEGKVRSFDGFGSDSGRLTQFVAHSL